MWVFDITVSENVDNNLFLLSFLGMYNMLEKRVLCLIQNTTYLQKHSTVRVRGLPM